MLNPAEGGEDGAEPMQCYEKARHGGRRERLRARAGGKASARVATKELDLRSEEDPELREMGQDMAVRELRDARCRDCVRQSHDACSVLPPPPTRNRR